MPSAQNYLVNKEVITHLPKKKWTYFVIFSTHFLRQKLDQKKALDEPKIVGIYFLQQYNYFIIKLA